MEAKKYHELFLSYFPLKDLTKPYTRIYYDYADVDHITHLLVTNTRVEMSKEIEGKLENHEETYDNYKKPYAIIAKSTYNSLQMFNDNPVINYVLENPSFKHGNFWLLTPTLTWRYLPKGRKGEFNSINVWGMDGRQELKLGKGFRKLTDNIFKDSDYEEAVYLLQHLNDYKYIVHDKPSIFYEYGTVDGFDVFIDREQAGKWSPSSCMFGSSDYLEIYDDNEQFNILVIARGRLVLGRALLITTDCGTKLMETIYAQTMHRELFKTWANENGYIYKDEQSCHCKYDRDYTITLKSHRYSVYPYVDAFKYFDYNKGVLSTDAEDFDGEYYVLDCTDGDYSTQSNGVWSDYHDCTIPEDEEVYSDVMDSYIFYSKAIEVYNRLGNRHWAIEDWAEDNDYVKPEDCSYHYHISRLYKTIDDLYFSDSDNVAWSDIENGYIHIDNAIEALVCKDTYDWVKCDDTVEHDGETYYIDYFETLELEVENG